jgi:hypothetical protein
MLDDLAVSHAQDRSAVDLHRLTGRFHAVERRPGMGSPDGPVGDDEIARLDEQVDREDHVGKSAADLRPPFKFVASHVGADRRGIHPLGYVAHEIRRPKLEDRFPIAPGHRIAVRTEQRKVLRHDPIMPHRLDGGGRRAG